MSETRDIGPWFTVAELSAARMPSLSARQIKRLSPGWKHRSPDKVRKRPGKGGGFEYHISVLPDAVVPYLLFSSGATLDEVLKWIEGCAIGSRPQQKHLTDIISRMLRLKPRVRRLANIALAAIAQAEVDAK